MRVLRLSLVLAIAILGSVGSLWADSSVQWGDETSDVAVSRSLLWKKPKAASGGATAEHDLVANYPIRQVQFQETGLPTTPPPTMTPAQRDTMFPELRPQANTPPSGATNVPSILPTPVLPTPPLQTPSDTESAPVTGTTPAPGPADASLLLPQHSRKTTKEIDCPDTAAFKSIREISYDIRPMPGELPKECPLKAPAYTGRFYSRTNYLWNASALCTKGAYFENVQLERYGHSLCPALEPIFSGVRFFVTIPLLPYKMGLAPPNECVYTLGHYRVGNCAPYMLDPLPVSVRAILFEAVAVGGAIAIIP